MPRGLRPPPTGDNEMIRPNTAVTAHADQDLIDTWAWVNTQRVLSGPNKGYVRLSAAKLGDRILAEASRRGIAGKLAI